VSIDSAGLSPVFRKKNFQNQPNFSEVGVHQFLFEKRHNFQTIFLVENTYNGVIFKPYVIGRCFAAPSFVKTFEFYFD
jgi:hypothetical protein